MCVCVCVCVCMCVYVNNTGDSKSGDRINTAMNIIIKKKNNDDNNDDDDDDEKQLQIPKTENGIKTIKYVCKWPTS